MSSLCSVLMRSLLNSILARFRRCQPAPAVEELGHVVVQDTQQVAQIAESDDPASVLALIGCLHRRRGAAAKTAAEAIQRIITACDPLELARLDQKVREMADWRAPQITPRDVPSVSFGLIGTLGVISFHPNGYVRRAAVRSLAEVHDGQELGFLLIRLNDWVPTIRKAARVAVDGRVRPDFAEHFIRNLPLVYRLREQAREDHQPVVDAVLGLVGQNRPALRVALGSEDRHTRRLAFRLLAEGEHEDQPALLRKALASDDTVMRLWAARELRKRLDGGPLRQALERMRHDRFMPVRREALYGYIEKLPEEAPAELRAALLDPHRSIREMARFYLRQSGEQEFAGFYRERLNGSVEDELTTVIAGLGETGTTDDIGRLAGFLTHPNRRMRRAAVRAVGHLDPEGSMEELLIASQDESPSVAKAARDALKVHPGLLQPDRLRSLYHGTDAAHVRRMVLSLVVELPWWEAIPLVVTATGSEDEKVRAQAMDHLRRNQIGSSVRPSQEQVRMLEQALADAGPAVEGTTRERLLWVLSIARSDMA